MYSIYRYLKKVCRYFEASNSNSNVHHRLNNSSTFTRSWATSVQLLSLQPISVRFHVNVHLPHPSPSSMLPRSKRFPHQNSACISCSAYRTHLPKYHYPNYNRWPLQTIKFLVMCDILIHSRSSSFSVHMHIFITTLNWNTFNQVSQPYKCLLFNKTWENYVISLT